MISAHGVFGKAPNGTLIWDRQHESMVCMLVNDNNTSDDPITVTILDTATGELVEDSKWTYFWWSEGNGACDCNRELLFDRPFDVNANCLGCKRYLIIKTSEGSLLDLNDGYPDALIEKYILNEG